MKLLLNNKLDYLEFTHVALLLHDLLRYQEFAYTPIFKIEIDIWLTINITGHWHGFSSLIRQ